MPSKDFPNDAERIRKVKFLVDSGYGDKVLIAHDICTKHRLVNIYNSIILSYEFMPLYVIQVKYGGHGYVHILDQIFPKMVSRGISRECVLTIITKNVQQWLTFV